MPRPQPSGPEEAKRWRSIRACEGWARRRREGFMPKGRSQPHARDRQTALAMAYPVKQPTREQLREAYLADGGNQAGAETFVLVIEQDWRLYRAKGVHAATTGPRRAAGLAAAGHARCARTVRRHRALAQRLGLLAYRQVRVLRGGARRDYLRVEPRPLMSTCLRQHQQCPTGTAAGASQPPISANRPEHLHSPAPPGAPPPDGGRPQTVALRRPNSSSEEGVGTGPALGAGIERSAEELAAIRAMAERFRWRR